MARGLNECKFIGNVGQDPEIRFTPSGSAVANLSLAVSEKWKDKQSGQVNEKTEWVRLVGFNKTAEIIQQYVTKGARLYVSGKMQTRKWQDQNGQDKYSTEIVINDLIMLDGKPQGGNQGNAPQGGQQPSQNQRPLRASRIRVSSTKPMVHQTRVSSTIGIRRSLLIEALSGRSNTETQSLAPKGAFYYLEVVMNCEYVKQHYGVPAAIGRRVVVNGKPGVIAEDQGHHIGVLFDADKPSNISPCHPTWEVEYLGMGRVRKMTRSQRRYQRFMEYGDCFDSFIDFCRWDAQPERSWNEGAV